MPKGSTERSDNKTACVIMEGRSRLSAADGTVAWGLGDIVFVVCFVCVGTVEVAGEVFGRVVVVFGGVWGLLAARLVELSVAVALSACE